MKLKNKKILITAGPTWVPIDNVRVISNIATGETGILLAERLNTLGARITLLLGPTGVCCLNKKIRLKRFVFFNELKDILKKELSFKRYDVVIHSAAVSDYKSERIYTHKISSGIKNLKVNLVPTEKIIDLIKKIDSSLFLVGFKFESALNRSQLIKEARGLTQHANLDLVVANTIDKDRYSAYIVKHNQVCGPIFTKKIMVQKLIQAIGGNLWSG